MSVPAPDSTARNYLVIDGRGKVIADTSTRELLAAASGDRVRPRTTAAPEATTVPERAGATVAASSAHHP